MKAEIVNQYDEIKRVFEIQKKHKWIQKNTTAEQRKQKLLQLKDSIQANSTAVLDALYKDLRRSATQPTAHEYMGAVTSIDEIVTKLDDWMQDVEVPTSPQFKGDRALVRYESRGVCLLFGPWNFPFGLVFQPLVYMIAAGNTAIVKPNEMAPEVSKVTAKVIREVFDECEVAVFEGGVELSEKLLKLPVDHIFFTGSPAVGRIVMQAAAKNLASVTLELGGKNPVIIDRNTDLQRAASIVAIGRGENAGQICLCPEYVWVPNDLKDKFIEYACQAINDTYFEDGKINKQRLCTIVDERNLARVTAYLTDALSRGAVVQCGGKIEEDRSVYPTVLSNVPFDAKIMQEENFAPYLVVYGYDDIESVTAYLQGKPKPLAMYIFSEDPDFVDYILSRTSSGGVTVNNWRLHCSELKLPFGGVNESGMGSYHGIYGFSELSHKRAVFIDRTP